jgi:prophage antirepressor-like protein
MTIQGVRGRMNADGDPELNLEDVARGYGFTQIKNGVEYVRWETVAGYLSGFGFSQQVGKDTFIPENIFYKLGFKASNETARKFQDLVADEILPQIRKHGGYLTPAKIEEVLSDPDTIIRLATDLKTERERNRALQTINSELTAKNEDMSVKLNESEKFWTIAKFNNRFNLGWNMDTCQRNGRIASKFSRQRGFIIRSCFTNDDRFGKVNSYIFEVLKWLFLSEARA